MELEFTMDANGTATGEFRSAIGVPGTVRPDTVNSDDGTTGSSTTQQPIPQQKTITIIGVGHVFELKEILQQRIFLIHPDAVGVELDRQRLAGLVQREQDERGAGSSTANGGDRNRSSTQTGRSVSGQTKKRPDKIPLVYKMLGWFQESIAKHYNVEVGAEMLHALDAGRSVGAALFLIDLNARRMVDRIIHEMPVRERFRAVRMLLAGAIVGMIPFSFGKKTTIEKELDRFTDDYDRYMRMFARQLPTVKRILIDERDLHMATRLVELSDTHDRVVAVIGDGHIVGMSRIIRAMLKSDGDGVDGRGDNETGVQDTGTHHETVPVQLQIIRLRELRSAQ